MSTPDAAVNLMVEASFKADVLPQLNASPTTLLIEELVKAIAQVPTSLKTRMWGEFYGCLALVLEETDMRHITNDPALNCERMEKPPFTHPDITPLKTVTEDKQLPNKHKVTWDEYHLQEAFIFHWRAAILTSVMPQYTEEKELDYLGNGNETILSRVTHLHTWPS